MAYLIVENTFIKPFDPRAPECGTRLKAQHAFSQKAVDDGSILFCGPKAEIPGGGFFLVKAEKKDDVTSLFENDPFNKEGYCSYTFKEFRFFNGVSAAKELF